MSTSARQKGQHYVIKHVGAWFPVLVGLVLVAAAGWYARNLASPAELTATPDAATETTTLAETLKGLEVNVPRINADSLAVHSARGAPDLSEGELIYLHARQHAEINLLMSRVDEIVMAGDSGVGVTVGELQALHARQNRESELRDNSADVVIPADPAGSAALTVEDIRAIHDQQTRDFEQLSNVSEIVIRSGADGLPGMSQADVHDLHESQREQLMSAESSTVEQHYAAPLPEAGDPYLPRAEIVDLHIRQAPN